MILLLGLLAASIVVMVVLDANSCPIESVSGPDFGEFMTIVGFKNQATLSI